MFRYGDCWDGPQTNLGAPQFDKQLPAGAHVLGFFGAGAGRSLGIAYAVYENAATPSRKPYDSALDAVSLSFLLEFYEAHVKALDDNQAPLTTGAVVEKVIMHVTRGAQRPHRGRTFERNQGRRYVELIPEQTSSGLPPRTSNTPCSSRPMVSLLRLACLL